MTEPAIRAVVVSVDDDVILMANASFEHEDGQYKLLSSPKIDIIDRQLPDPSMIFDDQGDIEREGIFLRVKDYCRKFTEPIGAFGFSCFGNVDSREHTITHMPSNKYEKRSLKKFDVKYEIGSFLDVPARNVFVENDATAAALGEYVWGSGGEDAAFAYVWAGRGANIGLVLDNDVWKGNQHPEMGHFYPVRHKDDSRYVGTCPIHSDCLIGLAGRKTIDDRSDVLGVSYDKIEDILGSYFAQLCLNTMLTTAVQKIAVGGSTIKSGVLPGLVLSIRLHFRSLLKLYPHYAEVEDLSTFIVPAELGPEASILGMLEITRRRLSLAATDRQSDAR